MAAFCPECGNRVGRTDKFCRECGTSLAPPPEETAPAVPGTVAPARPFPSGPSGTPEPRPFPPPTHAERLAAPLIVLTRPPRSISPEPSAARTGMVVLLGVVGAFTLLAGFLHLLSVTANVTWGDWSGAILSPPIFLSWFAIFPLAAGTTGTLVASITMAVGVIFLGILVGLYRKRRWALFPLGVFGLFYVLGSLGGFLYSQYPLVPAPLPSVAAIVSASLGVVATVIVLGYFGAVSDEFA